MFSTTIPSSALMTFLGTLLIGKWGSVAHLCMSYGKQGIVKVSIIINHLNRYFLRVNGSTNNQDCSRRTGIFGHPTIFPLL